MIVRYEFELPDKSEKYAVTEGDNSFLIDIYYKYDKSGDYKRCETVFVSRNVAQAIYAAIQQLKDMEGES